ncbi:MAG: hypothetical protein V7739_02420 [Motiliproteus sp.]
MCAGYLESVKNDLSCFFNRIEEQQLSTVEMDAAWVEIKANIYDGCPKTSNFCSGFERLVNSSTERYNQLRVKTTGQHPPRGMRPFDSQKEGLFTAGNPYEQPGF